MTIVDLMAIGIIAFVSAMIAMFVATTVAGLVGLAGYSGESPLRRLWTWVTSYPMTNLGWYFTDAVSGEAVYRYRDRHGRVWLATGRWAIFRVECSR